MKRWSIQGKYEIVTYLTNSRNSSFLKEAKQKTVTKALRL